MHGIEFCPAHEADPDDIMELLCSSYGPTLAQDHSEELAQKALPVLCQPVPNLLKAAHYVLARREGCVVAVGGWSRETPPVRAPRCGGAGPCEAPGGASRGAEGRGGQGE